MAPRVLDRGFGVGEPDTGDLTKRFEGLDGTSSRVLELNTAEPSL